MPILKSTDFNLPRTWEINLSHGGLIQIRIKRSSRIIMKDGFRIAEAAGLLRKKSGAKKIEILTESLVCSKTLQFLSEREISIKQKD